MSKLICLGSASRETRSTSIFQVVLDGSFDAQGRPLKDPKP
ncbi:MAG TPA: hypothetical protein VJ323_07495 [Bryobacteraceae bacterium]|jgi:hypothetical protein|nr:hypothetical protein [Bryobacteraceae bacterium]